LVQASQEQSTWIGRSRSAIDHVSYNHIYILLPSFLVNSSDIRSPGLAANAFLASTAEIHLALICACAPSLRAVFKRSLRRPATRTGSTSNASGRGYNSYGKPSFHSSSSFSSKSSSANRSIVNISAPMIITPAMTQLQAQNPPKPQAARMSRPPRISRLEFLHNGGQAGDYNQQAEAPGTIWAESLYTPSPLDRTPSQHNHARSESQTTVKIAPRVASVQVTPEWSSEHTATPKTSMDTLREWRKRESVGFHFACAGVGEVPAMPEKMKGASWYRDR
jgi:hypothetical protein